MNKTRITKITTYALILVMVASMLLTATMSAFGGSSTSNASFVQQMNSINTNYQQYLDSSVVTKLPDSVKDTDEISVIVSLDTPALLDVYNKTDKKLSFAQFTATDEARAVLDTISEKKIEALKSLNNTSVEFVTGEHYDSVLSGFEIVIKAKDFERVCSALGDTAMAIVGEVYNVAETTLVENKVNIYEETGIFNSADFKYDGTGMVVAVLDTGLDYTHSAFSAENFKADRSKLGLTKDMVAALIDKTRASQLVKGLTADDVYLNDGKVPFSFDYADSDADVYSLHNNHGTHVSGVITGKDDVITGVAPNAQLVSMKIFSDVKDTARTSWILGALEDCVVLGVDVINMSLGTACGFSREMDREAINGNVYQKIRDAGISMVVAASNSYSSAYGSDKNGNLGLTTNPDTSTVGSPSTYEGAMSVASINGKKTPYLLYNGKIIYFVEATDSASEEKEFVAEILPEGTNEKEFEYVTIPGAGRFADYTGMDVTGKIVLVRRGSNTFEEKANAAQKAGAAGIIIYNNVSGDIKMNAGITTIPIISISQDDGEELAAAGRGTIKISRSQSSGPFISDFSSWGPSPDLGIKPEITAHGGNILSAITGGGYDRLSGTSMACPNMAGVTILLRQYVVDEFPEIANDPVKVAALVNCLSMSTADVIYNKNGLPYAVRKQGAGLANLVSASTTKAYIMTYDRVDGSVMDKSKIELGDDPAKTGVYTLKFSVNNFGDVALKYELSAHVMTEGVSDTKTNDGATTVTEEGYALSGAVCEVVAVTGGGSSSGNTITVEPNSIAHVEYKITLSEEDKKYLDSSFKNGMYVEGFVNLKAVSGTDIDLGVPYLAFYGDWTVAPIFDLDYYETNKDELDDGVSEEDKTKADAYATRPIGGVSSDFVSYLGSYYFLQNPENKIISASRDYVAISNVEGTVHKLRFVWAGLLRNAERIEITIVDTSTGEEIFKTVDDDVRKSYGDGGSIYPANVEIEFDASEHNLKNNTQYNVKLQAFLDYGDGGVDTNLKNTFEFPLYADFEAPAVTGCEFYTEYDKTLKKNRLFARIAIFDNHYAMAMQVGYVGIDPESEDPQNPSYLLNAFESYLTPVYSQRNSTTYVEYELTDFVHQIKEGAVHKNSFTVATYDYALNEATYEISLPTEYIDLYFEEESVTLSPNQTYNLNPLVYPTVSWGELLNYTSSNQKVARVVKNQIIAVGTGSARIYAQDPETGKYDFIDITVLGEGDEGYKRVDKPVVQRFELIGYETLKAFFYLNNDDREIGMTGEILKFVGDNYSLSMFPSEAVKLEHVLDAYFPDDTEVVYESNNESIVKVDQSGTIVAVGEGFSSVTIRVLLDGRSTFYSETVSISVKDPFIRSGPQLTHYFGNGGVVNIPASLLITEIGSYAFSNFDYVEKDENDEISEEEPDATKQWFIGEATVEKVIIPEGVKKIGPYAFANLTALREVVLPTTLEAIEYGAFFGCTSLEKVTGIENVELINYGAFEDCNLKGTISLDDARAIGDNVFKNNRRLEGVVLPETLQSIGARAFEGDTALKSVTIKADKVKYGPYVFSGCSSLEELEINTSVIPAGAFNGARSLKKITIGKDVNVIGEYAFANTAVSSFTVKEGNGAFKAQTDGSYILSKDEKTLVLVSPTCEGKFALNGVTSVANGAFSSTLRVTEVELKDVTSVGNYAFADCERITKITLGALTNIGEYAFSGTSITVLPSFDKIGTIGKYAFAYTDITEATIPDGMVIGEGAFCECSSLRTVNIGDNVTIGTGAFMLGRGENNEVSFYEKGGKKFYYYIYTSPLQTLIIGDNAVIGDSAFMGAATIKEITLGKGAVIGNMSFYNCCALEKVNNLDKAVSIGNSAFSGDVLYEYATNEMTTMAVYDNAYIFRYYASALKDIDISSATTIGQSAFQYCMSLESVIIGDELKVIPVLAFANCSKLTEINLGKVVTVETNAFAESDLKSADLSSAETVYEYAFVYNENLKDVSLNENGTSIKEGAFAYCTPLKAPKNIEKSSEIGAYSFAYTAIDKVDLSSAVTIGDHAFLKESLTPFEIKLGSALEKLGDNPFAYCILKPFESKISEEFNGVTYESVTYDFNISENVKVVDGSLYCKVPNGYELITFCGKERANVKVADGTVRITAYAFAGSDVVRVILPHTVRAIGHKAMFDCDRLVTVVFGSYNAPILEEEMDMEYYNSYENIPATGEYAFLDGSNKVGLELVPYYMWNATSYKYVDCYYGANFIDHIGHIEKPIVMVRPTNGQYYDTFIYNQYFSVVIDGTVAPKDETLLAIEAIEKLPDSVRLTDEALVIAARLAYDKIATKDQQALVTNYSKLVTAENRIIALKSALEDDEVQKPDDNIVEDKRDTAKTVLTVFVIIESVIIVILAAAVVTYVILKKKGISTRALIKRLFKRGEKKTGGEK